MCEANGVRFDEVYFKIFPNLVGLWFGVPADKGTVVEARSLDRANGFVDELWLGERQFCNESGDEAVFQSVKKCFNGIHWVPFCVECCFVCLLLCRCWASVQIAWGCDDVAGVLIIFVVLCTNGVTAFESFRDGVVQGGNDGRLDVRL